MQPPSLKDLIGKQVLARISVLNPSTPTPIIIHAVEAGGLWIEHEKTNQKILHDMKQAASENTYVVFVPYSGIDYVVGTIAKTALSESAFSR